MSARAQGKANSTPKAECNDNLTDSNKEFVKPERPSSLQVNFFQLNIKSIFYQEPSLSLCINR